MIPQIFTGNVPFFDVLRDVTVVFKVMSGERPVRPDSGVDLYGLTDVMWNLMERCWLRNPSARPTADNLVKFLQPITDTRPNGQWESFSRSMYDASEILSAYDVDSLSRVSFY